MIRVSAIRSSSSTAELNTSDVRAEQAALLYEQFGKPLEPTHVGQYVAITSDGRSIVGDELLETIRKASTTLGPGSFVFKVGEGVVGTWR